MKHTRPISERHLPIETRSSSRYVHFMNPEEIRQVLRAIPFVPFRVHTSDGKRLEIKHPEMAFLTRTILFVGRPVADPTEDVPDRADSVSVLHVVRLEPLIAA